MAAKNDQTVEQKLDLLIRIMQQLLALELLKSGVSIKGIGKHLHVREETVREILKGVKRIDE